MKVSLKIKQIKNDKINSFEFSSDLSKNDYLKKILKLYSIGEVYICIYGLGDKVNFKNISNEIQFKKSELLSFSNFAQIFILNIDVDEISNLFSIINNNFDEMAVWSPYTSWENFVKSVIEPVSLFTFCKTEAKDDISFYLNFKASDFNVVEIISSLSFNNSANITKDDFIKILN